MREATARCPTCGHEATTTLRSTPFGLAVWPLDRAVLEAHSSCNFLQLYAALKCAALTTQEV